MTNSKETVSEDFNKDLELAFTEIRTFFQNILIEGLSNLSTSKLEELGSFKERLITLGALNLAEYLQQFADTYSVTSNLTKEEIHSIIELTITILTYIRVFDRVKTKEIVLADLKQTMKQSSESNKSAEKSEKKKPVLNSK